MATYNNKILVLSGGLPVIAAATDTIQVTSASFSSASFSNRVDFTGATVVGLSGGTSITNGGGTVSLDGSGNLATSGVPALTLDSTGVLELNSSGGVISIANDAVNQNVQIATGGTRTVTIGNSAATINVNTAGGASTVTVKASNAAALTVTDGTTSLFVVDSSTTAVKFDSSILIYTGSNSSGKAPGFIGTAGEAISQYNVVCVSGTSGKIFKADADVVGKIYPVGVCLNAPAGDGSAAIVAWGAVSPVTFTAAPASTLNGQPVYLSLTAGSAQTTAPTGSGEAVSLLGYLIGANGSDTTVKIVWQPQFIGYYAP